MIYTEIFQGCKNDNFQMKSCDILHIFSFNIDCGYSLEPHISEAVLTSISNLCFTEAVLTGTHNLCHRTKMGKCIPL